MAEFSYRAYRDNGAATEGRISARDPASARRALRAQGLHPSLIDAAGSAAAPGNAVALAPVKLAHLAFWAARMTALVTGGVELDRALEITVPETPKTAMDRAARRMQSAVRDGAGPAEAARLAGLPASAVGVLRAAEATGDIGAAFGAIEASTAAALARRRAIINALTYPILLVFIAIGAFAFMLLVIIPRFEPIFARALSEIPLTTQRVLALSGWVRAEAPLILTFLAAASVLLLLVLRSPLAGRLRAAAVRVLPGGAGISAALIQGRILNQLAGFLAAGVTLPDALALVRNAMDDPRFADRLAKVAEAVQTGTLLSDALRDHAVLEGELLSLVRAGEESGALVAMLRLAAQSADSRADTAIKRLLVVLEPVLILLIGVIIGGMILSIFQAVLSINDVVI
ncbi:type II secretion system F family protein [uncultured Roseobacter sp.]|uniref:type II secretion system F family protein n=1 Tax=uncultured Roseobacter sp. TaxID=114847 RepID=UPI002609498F|nr:type II secretion system F family protein [uncultured Roseobacter sp.]